MMRVALCVVLVALVGSCAHRLTVDPMAELLALQGNDMARIEHKCDLVISEVNRVENKIDARYQMEKAIYLDTSIQMIGIMTK